MRLFVALDLPDDIKQQLGALQFGLQDAYWSKPENAHITLCFLGDLPEAEMIDLGVALGKINCPAFEVKIEGVGVFGNAKRPRILWAGVKQTPEITHLQQKIATIASRHGIKLEDRKFKPHITLGRVHNSPYDSVRGFLMDHGLFKTRPILMEYFTLFSSQLGHGGPHYEEEFIFDLEPLSTEDAPS
ncbi:RNA 2',3'-cyclic phosphodiesterase [Sneathiella sp. P13V-1]|uniref:RNA 2',3'-cyclic phosphodiesterase n=1 Tax=Sneathiella sp. P13V-1 TaxID=2697366 RepID=UPI00187B67B9|nr:RNA 2',3'-cyclic phosphodiesterase [Sneathiella sp. P13V-1]MBE7636441.1 RNA 2',3'-cyclic phosphodiesterase [Sneathiella sp. P13V-1]